MMVSAQFSDLAASAPPAAVGVGAFVLFGQPPAGAGTAISSGISALVVDASNDGMVAPWMSTDEEGGEVQRLANVLGALPSPREMASEWTTSEVESALAAQAQKMRGLGVTMDLAPVLDTASPNDVIADENTRSFSEDGQVAAAYGVAFADGLESGGVVPVVKHFPGLGHANANTDLGPATDPPLSQLETDDLIPFESAVTNGVPVVMVGHPIVPGLTNGLPASLSPATYTLLRQHLDFTGVTLTDSLGAGAISAAGYSEAAVAAVEAGADMVMVDVDSWAGALTALEGAVSSGVLPLGQVDSSVKRILAAKGVPTCT
ncbi:MAG: glycoside hydrolase family 3 N-terminal domain-containing protein, partial [Acidimicrobiales bacterium]